MRFYWCVLTGLISVLYGTNGMTQDLGFSDNRNFAFKVKQIDEFIDRFNNADFTPIKHYLKEEFPAERLDRQTLIISLFNQSDTTWREPKVRQFLEEVTQTPEPPHLDFYGDGWYAEIDCTGQYKGKEENFTLTLAIETIRRTGGAKWVIEGVSANFLSLPRSRDQRRALNPASYGTDFIGLIDALKDTANFRNYTRTRRQPSQLLLFFDELEEQQLIFEQVNRVKYHFLQIDNWIFTVEDFKRDTPNSGWLISDLMKVDDVQKMQYQEKVLHID